MPAILEGLNLGDLLKYEAPNLYSRDIVAVPLGMTLALGAVVGIVTRTDTVKPYDPAATDGSEIVAGVMLEAVDATTKAKLGVMLARHAAVADHALQWAPALTAVEKTLAVRQLKTLGILVRKGV